MSTGLTFYQARAISGGQNLHVRRGSWSDSTQWFIFWRGLWWYFTTGIMRPVQATDYTSAELLATDWTTVPESLAACPIDTTIGSTGGGPPNPGNGGFAVSDPTTVDTSLSGSGSSSGGAGGGPSLPPTPPGGGLSVTVAGTTALFGAPNVNGTFPLTRSGSSTWGGGRMGVSVSVFKGSDGGFVVTVSAGMYGASDEIGCALGIPQEHFDNGEKPPWDDYYGNYIKVTVN